MKTAQVDPFWSGEYHSYVCICVFCICVSTYLFAYTCIYIGNIKQLYTCTYVWVWVCVGILVDPFWSGEYHSYACICVLLCMSIYIHVCIYMYIYI